MGADPSNDTPPMALAVWRTVAVAARATAIFAVPSNDVPPMVLAVWRAVAVPARATAIFAVPSNDVPPMVLAVSNAVAVSAFPVTAPVNAPANKVAVSNPLEELNVRFDPDLGGRAPVASVVNSTEHVVSVDSSVTVTVDPVLIRLFPRIILLFYIIYINETYRTH